MTQDEKKASDNLSEKDCDQHKTTPCDTGDACISLKDAPSQPLAPVRARTLLFVAGAVACLAITGILEWVGRADTIQDFGDVGKEFYEDFKDATLASSLEVLVFDAENVRFQDFKVKKLKNGRWVIPSHHDYPADAKDRLANTAASIIGITRGAMVTRWKADHVKYGVIEPTGTSNAGDIKGFGSRLTLRGDNGSVLADYIIGHRVDENSNQYYVRHPNEDEVYLTNLEIDLSTKFTDWIDADLVQLEKDRATQVNLYNYSYDEIRREVTDQQTTHFQRKSSSDPWFANDLNKDSEEVDKESLEASISAINDLEIVGVRTKQKGLTPDLRLDRKALKTENDLVRLQQDLFRSGFLLQPSNGEDADELELIADEGELHVATDEGLIYQLYFGRAFTGSQEELETGLTAKSSKSDKAAKKEPSGAEKKSDSDSDTTENPVISDGGAEDSDENKKESDDGKPGRYIFVRVECDPSLLGAPPVKPTEPKKPVELEKVEAQKDASKSPASEQQNTKEKSEKVDAANKEKSKDGADKDEQSDDKKTENPLEKIRLEFEKAKQTYASDLKQYEQEEKDYKAKLEKATETAEKLNHRFAQWYYVVPGSSFEKLHLSRQDFVKEKTAPEEKEENADESDAMIPEVNFDRPDADGP